MADPGQQPVSVADSGNSRRSPQKSGLSKSQNFELARQVVVRMYEYEQRDLEKVSDCVSSPQTTS